MSGAYRFAGSFKRHPCPTSFNFGDGVAKDATKLSGYVYQGSVVLQGGATCEPTASITTVTTIFGQIPKSMAELGLSNGTRLLRTSNQPLVAWADSAGFFRGAWACGESPAWPDDTFVLWGDAALSWSSLGIRLKKGLRHMVFLTPKELMCAYSAPALAAGTPAPNGTTGGAGGGGPGGEPAASPTPVTTGHPETAEGASAEGAASPPGGGAGLSPAVMAAIAVGGVAAVVASGLVAFWGGHRLRTRGAGADAGVDAGADAGADAGVDVEAVGGDGAPPAGQLPPPLFLPTFAPPPGGYGGDNERRSVDLPPAHGGGGGGGALIGVGSVGGGGFDGGFGDRGGGRDEAAAHRGPPVASPPTVCEAGAAASWVADSTRSSTDYCSSGGGPVRRPTDAGGAPPPMPTLLRDMFPTWDTTLSEATGEAGSPTTARR